MAEKSELRMVVDRRMAELETKMAEYLAEVPMNYEHMAQLAVLELFEKQLAADSELYAKKKALEAELYEQKMALKAEQYAKQQEAEASAILTNAMDECLRTLIEKFGCDHTAILECLMADGGLFRDIVADVGSGRPTQERRAGWRGLIYRMLLPLFKMAQVLTGILPPAWMGTSTQVSNG